ncbi:hypothetical protein BACCOP_02783 [Phocaeicola coprocola DSM 17136]|uniref:Uncharacterized protein n=1 Tax=Phocaeicola coprocola DSM 17136 TaxID=470145 RepID=B3JLI8_9BACT|nr:hypothetical protein BACCOP_02783 [Phocaeicola coprocola DSM 17136]
MERERLRNCSKEINSTYRQSKTTQLNLRQFIESRKTKDITFSDYSVAILVYSRMMRYPDNAITE